MTDAPAPTTPGVADIGGEPHMRDAKGRWIPVASVKPADRLQDEMVRRLVAEAQALSATIAAFRDRGFEESDSLQALLEEQYKVKVGGDRGNVSYMTVDGCMHMQVAVADVLSFGPELKSAKALLDECLVDWGHDTHPVLRALLRESFDTDKEGRLNRSAIFRLLRQECDDPRWVRAMDAIRDSIRSTGSRQYVRFHVRSDPNAPWVAISLDAATAKADRSECLALRFRRLAFVSHQPRLFQKACKKIATSLNTIRGREVREPSHYEIRRCGKRRCTREVGWLPTEACRNR